MADHTMSAAASCETHRATAALKQPDGAEVIRGRLAANLVALSDAVGHSDALAYVNRVLSLHIVPSDEPKIKLVVSNSAETLR